MTKSIHTPHSCRAIVISCIDFRFQKYLENFTGKLSGGFDRVGLAGGVKNLQIIMEQIEISVRLHNISEVYLINHEDCGAYGVEGTFPRHKKDLKFAKKILKQRFLKLKVHLQYLKLSGEFVTV